MGLTGKGGMRIGAGRKSKSLNKKIYDGQVLQKTKKKNKKISNAEIIGADMPKPAEFLLARQKDGVPFKADEIYKDMWQWICSMGCEKIINKQLIEQYAMDRARWIQCENAISEYGFLGKHPTTGAAMQSPYVEMLLKFEKAMNSTYFLIRQEVREYCLSGFIEYTPEDAIYSDILD